MTTEMEKTADPGEILVSSGTRNQLPEGAATTAKGDGWLLKWRKAHCIAPGPVRREGRDPDEVRQWMSVALRDYLSAGVPEPEHRIATIGFIKFCGFDHLVESEGLDAASDALDATIASIQSAVDDEEVTFLATDINEDGGKVILAAGAPVAREEDEARILRAFRRIADSDTPLELHFGVNRGHVFTGEVGTEFRSTYTVMGDTVNLAARLMAAAPAGAIYATRGVLDQSSTLYGAETLEPFYVKGKEEPVHAYSLGEEMGERSKDSRAELPFVGRTTELAEIGSAIDDARRSSGSVVTVIGETGMGKSRLIRYACDQAPEVPVLSIHAEPYGAATPYRPFRDPMRTILDVERGTQEAMASTLTERVSAIDPDLLPMLPLLADVVHIDVPGTPEASAIEPRFRMDRLADVVLKLLDKALAGPAVINVEDAQWMDEASAHLLAHFTATAEDRPWAIFVTRRGHENGFVPNEGRTFKLTEITPDESQELVIGATAATPLRPHEIDVIVDRASGNPLFLDELLRVVRETGSTDELPDSLGTVVSASIDALPPLTRRVLRYCSVFGRSFRIATVQQILAGDGLELDAITRQLLAEFLEPNGPGRLRFRTAMVRDVAYDGLSFKRRREIHLHAGAAIETESAGHSDDSADQLAMHYSLGGDHERTWYYARLAGERAARSFANVEAAAQYERALDAASRLHEISDGDRSSVWSELGDVREQAGIFDEALDAYSRGLRLVRNRPYFQLPLLLKRAWTLERAGNYPVALRETTKAKKVADLAESERWRAKATAFAAHIRQRQEKPREALREGQLAIDEATNADDKEALAKAYTVVSWARLLLALPGARNLLEKALLLYEEIDDHVGQADATNNLGGLVYFEGRWVEALEYYKRSRSESERLGNVGDVGIGNMNIGEVLVNQGHHDDAVDVLRDASRSLRAIGFSAAAAYAEMQLGRALLAQGSVGDAQAILIAVRDEVAEGYAILGFESAIYLAECSIVVGDPRDALQILDAARVQVGDDAAIYAPTEARARARALAALDRRSEAFQEVGRGLEAARGRGMEYEVALLLLLEADLSPGGNENSREKSIAEATEILDRLGVRRPAIADGSNAGISG
jgi:class 3 adenylate cyclase/tetratricopeptide (TPR) repeat protein